MTAAPLDLHRAQVRPEWVDNNGHMHEAYYVLVFGDTTDALLDQIGIDAACREATATSVYTLEAHVSYLDEVGEGAPLAVTTQILDVDEKRLHVFHAMRHGGDGSVLATEELMLLHVATGPPRGAPFPPEVAARLAALKAAHEALPRPAQAGHHIAMPRRLQTE
ncbi:MAG: thioesterase family protein [Alphaproteobacteria bacterium]